jgi:hypothetical protein
VEQTTDFRRQMDDMRWPMHVKQCPARVVRNQICILCCAMFLKLIFILFSKSARTFDDAKIHVSCARDG